MRAFSAPETLFLVLGRSTHSHTTSLTAPPLWELSQRGSSRGGGCSATAEDETTPGSSLESDLLPFAFYKRYIYIRFWGVARTEPEPSAGCIPPRPQFRSFSPPSTGTANKSYLVESARRGSNSEPSQPEAAERREWQGWGRREPSEAALAGDSGGRAAVKTRQPPFSAPTHPEALFPDYWRTELLFFH